MADAELTSRIGYLKDPAAAAPQASRDPRTPMARAVALPLAKGGALDGDILNHRGFDAQLRTTDGDIVLLRRDGDAFRRATLEPFVDWPAYHGSDTANRHSPLAQIHRDNVGRLAAQWFFRIPDMPMIEGTPVVIAGVMYVTAVHQVYALDATTGVRSDATRSHAPKVSSATRHRAQPRRRGSRQPGVQRDRPRPRHRLDRFTGELVWDTEMDDYREHYGAVVARSWWATSSSRGSAPETPGCAASSTRITPRPASARGVSGRSPRRASPVPRPGAIRRCSAAVAGPPGLPAATTPSSTCCTGRPATRVRT